MGLDTYGRGILMIQKFGSKLIIFMILALSLSGIAEAQRAGKHKVSELEFTASPTGAVVANLKADISNGNRIYNDENDNGVYDDNETYIDHASFRDATEFNGSDAAAKIFNAAADCPAEGCIINTCGLEGTQASVNSIVMTSDNATLLTCAGTTFSKIGGGTALSITGANVHILGGAKFDCTEGTASNCIAVSETGDNGSIQGVEIEGSNALIYYGAATGTSSTVMDVSGTPFPASPALVGLTITNSSDATVADCEITSHTTSQITCAAGLTGGTDNTWAADDRYWIAEYNGSLISLNGTSGDTLSNFSVVDTRLSESSASGIVGDYLTEPKIRENVIETTHAHGIFFGTNAVDSALIESNKISLVCRRGRFSSCAAIYISGASPGFGADAVHNPTIIGNKIKNTGGVGIEYEGTDGGSDGLEDVLAFGGIISNNSVYNTVAPYGGECYAFTADDFQVINNSAHGCYGSGFIVYGQSYGATFTGNHCTDTSLEPDFQSHACIQVRAIANDAGGIGNGTISNPVFTSNSARHRDPNACSVTFSDPCIGSTINLFVDVNGEITDYHASVNTGFGVNSQRAVVKQLGAEGLSVGNTTGVGTGEVFAIGGGLAEDMAIAFDNDEIAADDPRLRWDQSLGRFVFSHDLALVQSTTGGSIEFTESSDSGPNTLTISTADVMDANETMAYVNADDELVCSFNLEVGDITATGDIILGVRPVLITSGSGTPGGSCTTSAHVGDIHIRTSDDASGGMYVCRNDSGYAWTALATDLNNLETLMTGSLTGEIPIGTTAGGAAAYVTLQACADDEKLEYTDGAPDTMTCEAIGSLVDADISNTLTASTTTTETATDNDTSIASTAFVHDQEYTICQTFPSLTTSALDAPLFSFNGAGTVTKYSCTSTGAISISLEHFDDDDDLDDAGAGTYACADGTTDPWITSFTTGDQTFDDAEMIAFDVISGTPTWTTICFAYTTP